ncbi:MAG: hypothetical protein CMF96_02300 [Candidatus Marinimicrobia bacterium]|nr:hypothetical protein [Candidatus Neomarinimicrobiota bacterium]|tara:strand:- start:104 stop:598 length:495 start_codon:yes stop_codon:yes gene_type:complete
MVNHISAIYILIKHLKYILTKHLNTKKLKTFISINIRQSNFIKFAFVGSCGLITNLFIFYVSINFLKFNLNISSVLAFIFANFQNYIFNSKWTFVKSNKKIRSKTYIKFLISSLIGIGSNLIVLNTVVFMFGENAKFFGQIFGILSGSIFNYLFSKYFVFEMKK